MPRIPLAALALLALVLLALAPAAHTASPDVVVSQVYAGGGNAGAAYTHDLVELFNRGSATIDVGGWTLQYASASGATWQSTPLTGSIAPGRAYLVQLASSAAVGATPPAPDATGTTNLANTGGKLALVRGATALTCGATAGSCAGSAQIADLVGWGSATDYEGSAAAAALDNTTALVRAGDGCTDTDANASDFAGQAPSPRSSASPAAPCGSQPTPGGGTTQGATVDVDVQPVLSVSLERASLSFGAAAAGDMPPPVSERVTVVSSGSTGYALTAHRTAFTPADLPLGLAASAPSGGQVAGPLAGGAMAALPVAPAADLLVGTTAARSAPAGDVWTTSVGFVAPLPAVAPGRYTATVTYTVVAR